MITASQVRLMARGNYARGCFLKPYIHGIALNIVELKIETREAFQAFSCGLEWSV